MAEEVILDLKVETGESNIRVGELTQGVKELKQEIESIDLVMVGESFTTFTNTVEAGFKSSVATATLFANKTLDIQNVLSEKLLKSDKELAQARVAIANSVVSSLASLGTILIKNEEKAAKFQKGIAVAQLAIDTAVAISSAIRVATQSSITPIDLIANIATTVAVVLANIAKAKQLLSKAKGPAAPTLSIPTGGVGGGIKPTPPEGPRLGPVGRTRLNPDGTIAGEPRRSLVKAFVVETEMTEKQKKIRRLQENVTFD